MITEEHRVLRRAIRTWAEAEVGPTSAIVDREARFPAEAWSSYVANGWVKMQYPAEYGGDGADALSCAILVEEIARVCASTSLTVLISKLGMTPVLNWGSEELPDTLCAEDRLGGLAGQLLPVGARRRLRRGRHVHQSPSRR